MMKKIILLVFHAGILLSSFGQALKADNQLSTLTKLDLGFQGIGLTYEKKLSNKIVLDLSAGAGGGYDIAEGSLDYNLAISKPAFYFSCTPKYYYNRLARMSKGKNTRLNSGNYIGLRLKYVTPNDKKSDHTRNSMLVNVHWGIQRAIGNRWTFNAHAGAGYAQDIDYNFGTVYPALDLWFSYVL